MKKCPYCAEEILDDAIKCRFCGEFLKKRKKWVNCLFGCLITVVALILLAILILFFSYWMLKFVVYKIFFAAPNLSQHPLPFTGGGIEGILKDFSEALKALLDKLKDFITSYTQNQKVTF